jgi:hypothetical protein
MTQREAAITVAVAAAAALGAAGAAYGVRRALDGETRRARAPDDRRGQLRAASAGASVILGPARAVQQVCERVLPTQSEPAPLRRGD